MRYFSATPIIFPPNDDFSEALTGQCLGKDIDLNLSHNLTAIDKDNRVATITNLKTGDTMKQDFDMLHIVPPQSAPDFIAQSELAKENGWLDVNINTLQHNRFSNIFGLGDACDLPTPKTAAAIFSQTPVMVNNLLKEMGKAKSTVEYDGYAACPIFTSDKKLMLCEFKYGRKTDTSFFKDQTKPTSYFFSLKRDIFPRAYWNLMPRGKWFGASGGVFKPTY